MRTDVRIDGQSVDLAEELTIPVTLINPHLTYESIPDSRVTVPAAPFSLHNQRLFQYAEIPQAGNDLRRYRTEVLYNGALIYKGLSYVKSADPVAGYELEVSDELSRFFGEFQNIPLTELDLGTLAMPSGVAPVITDSGQPAACFPVISNPDYYGTNGAAVSYTGVINDYASSYKTAGPKVPILFVNFVLQRIADLTGITLAGSFLEHPTWQKLILTNWRALDGATAITVNKHVPAWTIPNFLLELRKIPNLQLTFDSVEKRLTLDFWEEQLTKPAVKDWTEKAVAGHKKHHELNRRLHLAYSLDGGDGLLKDRPEVLEDYITPAAAVFGDVANGLVKVNFQLSTFPVDDVTGLPVAKQTGVTEEFNQLAVSTQPRLLFWHGIVSGKPLALPELDGISLYLSEPDGLAETYWSNTEQQRLEMFYLQKDFTLNELDLATFDFSEKIHYNGLDYLVASITGELPVVKPFTCLLVKG